MVNKYGEKIPNLFIVGAPKCGTTSLHYWLSQHPEIFMIKYTPPKTKVGKQGKLEPQFFNKDHHREADNWHGTKINYFKYRDKKTYLKLFKEVKKEKIRGESTVHYLYSSEAPKKIREMTPNAKIIISLRNPVDFMESYHSQMLKGHEDIKNFKKAIYLEEGRKEGNNLPREVKCPSYLYYKERACFSYFIKNYYNYFENSKIKIIALDDIKKAPLTTYREILKFLNVENINFIPKLEPQNYNTQVTSIFLMHFLKSSNYKQIKKPIQKIIPKPIRKKIYIKAKNNNIKVKPRKSIDLSLKKKLMKEFKPEVEELSKITNRDLVTLWGYDKI
ncbi:MAG: sulfotransferase [Patescibacteria group bacterium]